MDFRFSENGQENWVECFKTGRHTDSNGTTLDWTEPVLEKIVNKFNEGDKLAPVQETHNDGMPALGFIDKLKLTGEKMYARIIKPLKEFKESVQQGEYRGVSIKLSKDLGLEHLAFLKDKNPAVKGMAYPYIFAENSSGNWNNLELALFQRFNAKDATKIIELAKNYFGALLSDAELQVNCGKFFMEMYKVFDGYVCTDAVPMVFYFLGINMSDGEDKQYSYKSESQFSEHPQIIERKNAMKEFADYYNNGRKTKSEIFAEQNNISDKERAFAEMEAKQRGVSFSDVVIKQKSLLEQLAEERNKKRGV